MGVGPWQAYSAAQGNSPVSWSHELIEVDIGNETLAVATSRSGQFTYASYASDRPEKSVSLRGVPAIAAALERIDSVTFIFIRYRIAHHPSRMHRLLP